MKGFTRTMKLNRNLTKTLLAATVALGTLCSSSAAFAATGSHAASTAKARGYKIVTLANGGRQSVHMNPPEYEGGRAVVRDSRFPTRPSAPEYDGGRVVVRDSRFLARPSSPEYDGGRAVGPASRSLARPSGPDYDGG